MTMYRREDMKDDKKLYSYIQHRIDPDLSIEQNTAIFMEQTGRNYKEVRLVVAERIYGILKRKLDDYVTKETKNLYRMELRQYAIKMKKYLYMFKGDITIEKEYNRFIEQYPIIREDNKE